MKITIREPGPLLKPTSDKIEAFQGREGLKKDGVPGEQTSNYFMDIIAALRRDANKNLKELMRLRAEVESLRGPEVTLTDLTLSIGAALLISAGMIAFLG